MSRRKNRQQSILCILLLRLKNLLTQLIATCSKLKKSGETLSDSIILNKNTATTEITRDAAIQVHSRSSIVLIDAAYMISY